MYCSAIPGNAMWEQEVESNILGVECCIGVFVYWCIGVFVFVYWCLCIVYLYLCIGVFVFVYCVFVFVYLCLCIDVFVFVYWCICIYLVESNMQGVQCRCGML